MWSLLCPLQGAEALLRHQGPGDLHSPVCLSVTPSCSLGSRGGRRVVVVTELRRPLWDVGEALLLSGPGVRICGLEWRVTETSLLSDAAVTLCIRRAAKDGLLYGAGGLRPASWRGGYILIRWLKASSLH